MQISCEFVSDFFEKRLPYFTTIAPQKSCEKPANPRAAFDEKPTPVLRDLHWLPIVKRCQGRI